MRNDPLGHKIAIRSALVLGASGLVGSKILTLLIESPFYSEVRVVTRRPLGPTVADPKVREIIVDFDAIQKVSNMFAGHDVFCAFGTTIKKSGTRERFRTVDCEYPSRIARIAKSNGSAHFLLVSSKGASSTARNFYLKVKGELEDAVLQMGWDNLTILRPSVIGGARNESRPAERIAQLLLSAAPASVRTVPAKAIAAVMIAEALTDGRSAVRIIESNEILSLNRAMA